MIMTIKNKVQIQQAILDLKNRKAIQEEILLHEIRETFENIKPLNLLKNTIRQVAASPDFRSNLLKGAVGIGTGMLSQNIIMNGAAGIGKKILGNALKFGIATLVAKNAEKIKSAGSGFISKLFKRKSNRDNFH